MKVCLINPTNKKRDWGRSFPPLGIAYIAAQIKALGIKVFIFDRDLLYEKSKLNMEETDKLTEEMLSRERPDVIGIGVTTPLVSDAYKVARCAKRILPSVRVVLGGVHATVMPHQTMGACSEIDCLVVGEGEKAVCEILAGKDPGSIHGVFYRSEGKIMSGPPPELIEDMDSILYPAREFLDMETYTKKSKHLIRGVSLRGTSVFTTRGCPFRCSFCCAPLVFGRGVRFHSIAYVVHEIEQLIDQYKIEGIYFADDMFASRIDRAVGICDELIKRGLNKKIVFAVQLKVTAVTLELLLKLKEAGCIQVEYGFESASQKMLNLMNKGVKVEDNYRAAFLTRKAGLRMLANLITGMPNETKEDFKESMRFLKQTRPDVIGLYKLILLPGSKLFNDYSFLHSDAQNWDLSLVDDLTTNFTSMESSEFVSLFKKQTRKIALSNARNYFLYHIKNNFLGTIYEAFLLVMNKMINYFRRRWAGVNRC